VVLSSLEAHADNKNPLLHVNARVATLELATTHEIADDALGHIGRTLVHLLGAGFEEGGLAVGEEVVRVDRDAVATDTETGSVGHVSEGLGSSGVGNFERIDTKTLACIGHLIGVGDTHHALAVLVELAHLGDFGLGNGDDTVEDAAIETDDGIERAGDDIVETGDDLGDGSHGRFNTAGVDALLYVSMC